VKQTLYIETTIVSYLTSRPSRDLVVAAHQQVTREWWQYGLPRFESYVSSVVLNEIKAGDADAAALRMDKVVAFPVLEATSEVEWLAEHYYGNLSIPEKARADCYHLALASWHGMDYLLSWNMAHIVNGVVIRRLQELNALRGIRTPVICTPEELLEVP